MSDLKDKANPINGLYAALICEIQELVVEQRITNELLAENGKKHDTTNVFKQEQQDGDIKFRKLSTKMGLFSVGIALTALYISIAGADSAFAEMVRATLKGWGVL